MSELKFYIPKEGKKCPEHELGAIGQELMFIDAFVIHRGKHYNFTCNPEFNGGAIYTELRTERNDPAPRTDLWIKGSEEFYLESQIPKLKKVLKRLKEHLIDGIQSNVSMQFSDSEEHYCFGYKCMCFDYKFHEDYLEIVLVIEEVGLCSGK